MCLAHKGGSGGRCKHGMILRVVGDILQSLAGRGLDGDTKMVSFGVMTDVTSKVLHEKTGQLLDRLKRGERFRVLRDGKPDAFLLPATDAVDPEWSEIMAEVWAAQDEPGKTRPNPILKQRKKRNYAARLR